MGEKGEDVKIIITNKRPGVLAALSTAQTVKRDGESLAQFIPN